MCATTVLLILLITVCRGLTCYHTQVPPHITLPTERTLEVRLGETIDLKCQDYFPIKWLTPIEAEDRTHVKQLNLYSDGHISTDLFESSFTRIAATSEDTGYYHCVKADKRLEDKYSSDYVYVRVTGGLQTSTEIIKSENIEAQSLKNIDLDFDYAKNKLQVTCRALIKEPAYHIYWDTPYKHARKNGQIRLDRLPVEVHNGKKYAVLRLTVLKMTGKDIGQYSCTMIQDSGIVDIVSIML